MAMLRMYVPIYNEEYRLRDNIGLIIEALSRLGRDYRLILVDDFSADKSLEILKAVASNDRHIIVRTFANGPSRRENLAQAMLDCDDDDIICFMDVDLSSDLSHLPELLRYVESGYDVAIGSRYMEKKPKRRIGRLLISYTYNLIIRALFSSKVRDHQCGFKAFRGKVLKKLAAQAGYDSSLSRGWFWDAEILIQAQKEGYKIKEFGVAWSEGETSSFTLMREMRIVVYMLNFRLRT
jgi:glycosyltransferase AglD